MNESSQPIAADPDKDAASAEPGGDATANRPRSALTDALHLSVLWSFAGAQPIYQLLSQRLTYLKDAGIEPIAIVLLTVGLSVLIPALLIALVSLAGLVKSGGRTAAYIPCVALLAAAIFMPITRKVPGLPGLVVVPLGILCGVALAWAYHRWRTCRTLVTAVTRDRRVSGLVSVAVADRHVLVPGAAAGSGHCVGRSANHRCDGRI
ncbi:MAG: hypothetical protein O3A00_15975 [Planctomycetota bacterium]|nr:hypothetical protein [Planctomycetota bacterium]